ncbi:DUF924 domain-containing protein [Martelella alba]|uniref:DUF924 domain-containing protein n=1 Tax=Martelella alba TaxID=2590451 RepID=A0A506U0X2_9HYPH|nr:DUF924 family protein [Martelella alba]TPW28002.1 DUF924 domain-containing protein [Martelella alba]
MSAEFSEVCHPETVLRFWFEELTPEDWFAPRDPERLDAIIRERFLLTHLALARDVDPLWRSAPDYQLAAVLVLDQFPRNMFRSTPLAFATDMLALREAKLAVATGAHEAVESVRRVFFFMPFEHSEQLSDQERCVHLFETMGEVAETFVDYARQHRDLIARFGRFPHRNHVLRRRSTRAELAFLAGDAGG